MSTDCTQTAEDLCELAERTIITLAIAFPSGPVREKMIADFLAAIPLPEEDVIPYLQDTNRNLKTDGGLLLAQAMKAADELTSTEGSSCVGDHTPCKQLTRLSVNAMMKIARALPSGPARVRAIFLIPDTEVSSGAKDIHKFLPFERALAAADAVHQQENKSVLLTPFSYLVVGGPILQGLVGFVASGMLSVILPHLPGSPSDVAVYQWLPIYGAIFLPLIFQFCFKLTSLTDADLQRVGAFMSTCMIGYLAGLLASVAVFSMPHVPQDWTNSRSALLLSVALAVSLVYAKLDSNGPMRRKELWWLLLSIGCPLLYIIFCASLYSLDETIARIISALLAGTVAIPCYQNARNCP